MKLNFSSSCCKVVITMAILSPYSSCFLDTLFCNEEQDSYYYEDEFTQTTLEISCDEHFAPLDQVDLSWEHEELVSLLAKEQEQKLQQDPCGFGFGKNSPYGLVARKEAVEWILKVKGCYGFTPLTAILAVNYVDRFLSSLHFEEDKPWMIQLVAVSCLSLAAKVEETQVPLLLDLQIEDTKFLFEAKNIQKMELLVMSTLKWRMNPVTPISFLDHIVRRLGLTDHVHWDFFKKCEALILCLVADSRFMCYKPSVLATATMLHVIDEINPPNSIDYKSQLLDLLKPTKESKLTFSVANMEPGHGDVEVTVQSLLECLKKEENQPKQSAPSIYRVGSVLKDHNPSAYKPRMVSIGPLHREDKNLQASEKEKVAHVFSLLSRLDSTHEETLQACTRKVNASIDHIRSCYAETISYNNIELTKMMVIDGCFILEYLYRDMNINELYLSNLTFLQLAVYDLVLLENQIPFLVLQHIFDCTISKFDQNVSLIDMIHDSVLEHVNPFVEHKLKTSSRTTHHHILGLLHECYHYEDAISSAYLNTRFPSVVELDKAGMNFKPIQNTEWPLMMEVKSRRFPCFSCSWGKRTLKMPVLVIDDYTELILRNLIAYEQYSDDIYQYFTSYAIAIDMLIDTQEDVATLVESEVIINCIGSNQEAANMINNLSKVVYWKDFFYYNQWMELNQHYNGYWSKNIAWLRRTYFNNPWNIIALFAAILLFALTIVQTIFTVNPAGSK